MKKEPVLIGYFAKFLAAGIVGLVGKYGLTLDPLQVAALIMTASAPISWWVRSKVSPVPKAATP